MPLSHYGVLRGRAAAAVRGTAPDTPHFQVRVRAGDVDFRIAVNVKSNRSPSELLFLVRPDFRHPLTAGLPDLPLGFSALPPRPAGLALDYIRGNLFDRPELRPLPADLPGPSNDLGDQLEHLVARATREPGAEVYAFGQRWGPEAGLRDQVFGFLSGNGVHDIHMNQGNARAFAGDDGVWQDGGLLLHFPAQQQWAAVFLAFQSQSWQTDDRTGHALVAGPRDRAASPEMPPPQRRP